MKQFFSTLLFIIVCAGILLMGLRGVSGNPTSKDINTNTWKDEGPLELSPERGRFALALSIIENNSFHFSLPIARFATPDLGYIDGKYVSLFAPLLSYIIIPGYRVGELFGFAQVGSFAIVSIFALINAILIRSISTYVGIRTSAASFGALCFLFASPAFAYGVSLYQHHISTFLILSCVFFLVRYQSLWSIGVIAFLYALSIPLDYPNAILMLPIAIMTVFRIIWTESTRFGLSLQIRPLGIVFGITAIIPIAFFLWFNAVANGSPFQLSGTVKSVKEIDMYGKPAAARDAGTDATDSASLIDNTGKTATSLFASRNLLNGYYLQTISPDRGILRFTPIMLLAIPGAWYIYQWSSTVTVLGIAIISMNLTLYALWGDPWGGWAFGSRYLIPGYAIASIFIASAVHHWKKNILLLLLCLMLFIYSAGVGTLGALTSNRNPPQVEVLALEKLSGMIQRYTYQRNYDMVASNRTKSFLYQTYLSDRLTVWEYYLIIMGILMVAAWVCLLAVTR